MSAGFYVAAAYAVVIGLFALWAAIMLRRSVRRDRELSRFRER
jgi:hypothetical protein